ncbi:MAG: hypothetical protein FWD73_03105 [Polyangiaceae bacterium]|nr:hypothetical protein [Polyangiaceae bacterium]
MPYTKKRNVHTWRGRWISLIVFSAIAIASRGCSNAHDNAKSNIESSTDWSDQLDQLASSGSQIYSYEFIDAPPEGNTRLTFDIHDTSADAACQRYSGSEDALADDFWFFGVELSSDEVGTYEVVSGMSRSGGMQAVVEILHRKNGTYVERYRALDGTVTVSSAPTPSESKAGAKLEATIDAGFPSHAVTQTSCSGGASADGGTIVSFCSCRDSNGTTFDCDLPSGQAYGACCYDMNSPRRRLQMTIDASPCATMCRVVPGIPNYCVLLLR